MGADARARVVADLDADLPLHTAALVAGVVAEVPAYGDLARSQIAEVSGIVAWGTRVVLRHWVDDTLLAPDELRRFRAVGAARALDGRPVDAVLRAYRVAGAQLVDLVLAAAAERLDIDDVGALARCVLGCLDGLSEAVFEGWSTGSRTLAGDRRRALADLLRDIVAGRQATPAALADRSAELGIHLPSQPCLVLLDGRDPRRRIDVADLDALVDDVLLAAPVGGSSLADAGATVLRGAVDGWGVILLPDGAVPALERVVAARGRRGCAVRGRTLSDARAAYRLAAIALAGAPERAFAHRAVLDEADAQVLALLTAPDRADPARLVEIVLGPLAGDRVLQATLDVLVGADAATDAARALMVHPQTVRYRRQRITALTGRDTRLPWDRFVLEVARLTAAPAP